MCGLWFGLELQGPILETDAGEEAVITEAEGGSTLFTRFYFGPVMGRHMPRDNPHSLVWHLRIVLTSLENSTLAVFGSCL